MSRRQPLRRSRDALVVLTCVATLVKVVSCLPVAHFGHPDVFNGVLGPAVKLLAAAATLAGGLCARRSRGSWVWFAAATMLWGLGDLYGQIANSQDSTAAQVPAFSFSDAALLAAYPCWYVGVVLGNQASLRHTSSRRWLDGLIVGCATLSVALALVLPTVLDGLSGVSPVQAGLAAAYPLGDLTVVGLVVVILVSQGRRQAPAHYLLAGALLIICGTDLSYALAVAHNTYTDGDLHDAGWVLGLSLIAVAPILGGRQQPQSVLGHRMPGVRGSVLPIGGTAVALCMLCLGALLHLSPVAVGFAAAAIALSCLRMVWSLQEASSAATARREARTDILTGLANRRHALEHVTERSGRHPLALLLLDLDGFKEINDALGHTAGDEVLIDVGQRLRDRLPSNQQLARLGGDEFVLIQTATNDSGLRSAALATADTVTAALTAPFLIAGRTVTVTASVGIALSPTSPAVAFDELLRRADIAMYRAKKAHTTIELYDPLATEGPDRLAQLQDIRRGLDAEEFLLHYQPKLNLRTGRIDGVEALARWDHPHRGTLAPAAFLDLITSAGLLPRLTHTVITQAAHQSAQWRRDGITVSIAVNLPPTSLTDAATIDFLLTSLGQHNLPTTALTIELTEDALIGDDTATRTTLNTLHRLGFTLSIDDFGTGYSSLAYLITLPIDEVKIDRSLIVELNQNGRATAVLGSIIDLAHTLNLTVVAEGIEDLTTLAMLHTLHCDTAQGYHIAKPAPPETTAALIRHRATIGTGTAQSDLTLAKSNDQHVVVAGLAPTA